jgi:hypothetical protein
LRSGLTIFFNKTQIKSTAHLTGTHVSFDIHDYLLNILIKTMTLIFIPCRFFVKSLHFLCR